MELYAHPFSSYSQKAEIAFYENGIAYDLAMLSPDNPAAGVELAALSPVGKFPLLVDGDAVVFEATAIIEHLAQRHPGPLKLIPDGEAGVRVRMLDRVFDNYVMTPTQKLVFDQLRAEPDRDPHGVAEARKMLETIYAWLDKELAGRTWAAGEDFSLADCAAAPSLFFADWAHPINAKHATLKAYRARLLARPSVARAVDEARPFRSYFPLGAPDRD
jgi:glutathione S-transferase